MTEAEKLRRIAELSLKAGDKKTALEAMRRLKAMQEREDSAPVEVTDIAEQPYQYNDVPLPAKKHGRGGYGYNVKQAEAANIERRKDVDALNALAEKDPYQAAVIANMPPTDRLLSSIGGGMTDIQNAVSAFDHYITPEGWWLDPIQPSSLPREPLNALESASSLGSAGRMVGQAAPFLPLGLFSGMAQTLPARILGSSLVGGSEGASVSHASGGDPIKGALVGAALGGGLEAATPVINSGIPALIRKVNPIKEAEAPKPRVDSGSLSVDDVIHSDQAIPLDAGSLERNARREQIFKDFGLDITEAQRTRNKDLFIKQQDLYKRSNNVTKALDTQDLKLAERFADEVMATGGKYSDVGDSPINAVLVRSMREKDEINALYKEAREAAPTAKNIRFDTTAATLRKYSHEDEIAGHVVKTLSEYMKKNGALTGLKATGKMSAESAENFRKYANELYDGANPRGRTILRDFKAAIDSDVGAVLGEDWFKRARDSKARFERGLDKEKLHDFDERNVSLVRDLLENKITGDQINSGALITSGSKYKAQDLKDLKRYYDSGSTPEDIQMGQKAWNDIRAQAMNRIRESAFGGSETELMTKTLTRAGLEKGIKQIGKDKFSVLFTPREQKFLLDLAELARYKEPPAGTYAGSGPTGDAVNQLRDEVSNGIGRYFGIATDAIKNVRDQKKILKIKNDLDEIEKARRLELMKPYRLLPSGAAAVAVPAAVKEEEDETIY